MSWSRAALAYMNPNAVKCPLCDGQVLGDSCRTCFAPIEVVKSILSAPSKPRFIGVLGPSGVGKTVYLGMLLDLLARGRCGLRGSASGPFSIALHRNTVLALEKQRFPDKTPTEPERWSWVHCEVSSEKRKQRYELVTPDVAGEALALELDAPGAQPTIQSLIRKCSSLIILLDIVDVIAHGQTQELFALQLISYLTSLHRGARRPIPIPVAVVFTKADLCDEPIDDVAAFARSNTPQLASLCQSRLAHYEFFAAGVAGACGILVDRRGRQSLVPLRVEPRGIIEPFSWVISQLR